MAQSSDGFSPELLDAMGSAFDAVWATIYAHVPVGGEDAEQLQINLSRTLIGLVGDGFTDPQDLRRKALESIRLSR